jgi:hypothetical protein
MDLPDGLCSLDRLDDFLGEVFLHSPPTTAQQHAITQNEAGRRLDNLLTGPEVAWDQSSSLTRSTVVVLAKKERLRDLTSCLQQMAPSSSNQK